MRRAERVDDDRVRILFDSGRWDELEALLSGRLARDEDDALARYRRANLWLFQARFDDTAPEFDLVRSQGLYVERCRNNKAVALAHASNFIGALGEFAELAESYAPACVNLAMVFASLPAVSDDAKRSVGRFLREPGGDAGAGEIGHLLRERARSAVDGRGQNRGGGEGGDGAGVPGWQDAEDHALDAAWVIWFGSLPASLGFPGVVETENVRESHVLLDRAIAAQGLREWEEARKALTKAVKLNPHLAHQASGIERLVLLGQFRDLIGRVKDVWQDDPPQGQLILGKLVALAERMGAEASGHRILTEELAGLSEELVAQAPHSDRDVLVRGTQLADALVELAARLGGEAPTGVSGAELERACASLSTVVASAWEAHVRHAINSQAFQSALHALHALRVFPPAFLRDSEDWVTAIRGLVYGGLLRHARSLASDGKSSDALDLLQAAEDSAALDGPGMERERQKLIALVSEVSQRSSAAVDVTHVEDLISQGRYLDALDEVQVLLGVTPFNARLSGLRAQCVSNEVLRIRSSLAHQRYEEALGAADALQKRAGQDEEVAEVCEVALGGWADHSARQAGVLRRRGKKSGALSLVNRVMRRVPEHVECRRLKDELRSDREAVDRQQRERYESCLQEFADARKEGILEAVAPLRNLVAASATEVESVRALAWFQSALTEHLEAHMLLSPSPQNALNAPDWTRALQIALELGDRVQTDEEASSLAGRHALVDLRGRWLTWVIGAEQVRLDGESSQAMSAAEAVRRVYAADDPVQQTEQLLGDYPWLPFRSPSVCRELAMWLSVGAEDGATVVCDPVSFARIIQRLNDPRDTRAPEQARGPRDVEAERDGTAGEDEEQPDSTAPTQSRSGDGIAWWQKVWRWVWRQGA